MTAPNPPKLARAGSPLARSALAATLIISGGLLGSGTADALASDQAEAHAQLIDADLLTVDLADAIRAESGYPSDPSEDISGIDAALLDQLVTVELPSLGIPLINNGSNDGLLQLDDGADLGLLNAYAYAPDANTATAASGAVTESGAIILDGIDEQGAPMASLELTALLGQLGIEGLTDEVVDGARLDVGVLASWAHAETGVPVESDYVLAGLELALSSPAVAALAQTVADTVGAAQTEVDSVIGPDGALETALAGAAVDPVNVEVAGVGALTVDLGDPQVGAAVDLSAAVDDLLTTPLTDENGLVSIDLSTGQVTIDLAQLHGGDLNDLPANTSLLTAEQAALIADVVTTLLREFVAAVDDAVEAAILGTTVTLNFDPTVTAGGAVTSDLAITVSGTVAEFLEPGAPTLDVSSTGGVTVGAVEVPLDALLAPALAAVLDDMVPVAQPVLSALLADVAAVVEDGLGVAVEDLITALGPVLDGVLADLLTLTVNEQINGADGSFTINALSVDVLPAAGAVELPLASSTVRVFQEAVTVAQSLTPEQGPETGGTEVTITGEGFTGATGVTFDGLDGTDFTVVDDNTITVTTPPHAPGVVEVVVTDESGDSEPLDFEYLAGDDDGDGDGGAGDGVPSRADSLSPASGPTSGGTTVTIVGEGFTGATGVTFDGVPGTGFVVVDDNTIRVVTPPHAVGGASVVVTDPDGNSAPLLFSYRDGVAVRPGLPSTGA